MKRWVFKVRNWLRERDSALQGREGVELMTVLELCVCQEQRNLDLFAESSISGERNFGMNDLQTWDWWKQVEGKDTDDLRNEFGWKFWYLWACEYFGSIIWRRLCVMELILYWTVAQLWDLSTGEMWALGRCENVWEWM